MSPGFLCGDPIPKAIDLNTRGAPTFPQDTRHFDRVGPPLAAGPEDDEDVIQMNEVRIRASDWVQRGAASFSGMIDGSGHPTASPGSQEDTTMLKTISAALLAVSVLAVAPAMAAGPGRTTHAPVFKSVQLQPSVLNAHVRMSAITTDA